MGGPYYGSIDASIGAPIEATWEHLCAALWGLKIAATPWPGLTGAQVGWHYTIARLDST